MHTWLLGWWLLWILISFLTKKEEESPIVRRHFFVLTLISAYYLFDRGIIYWTVYEYDDLWNYFFANYPQYDISPYLSYLLIAEFLILLLIVLSSYKTISGSQPWQKGISSVVVIYILLHLVIQGFEHVGFATSIIPGGTSTIATYIGIETILWVLVGITLLNWLVATLTRKI